MTVSSTTTKASYSGNGVTTVFAVPFYFLLNADLLVILRSAAGVETTQVLGTNYSVTGAGNENGGSITMTAAPLTGTTLTITRNAAATQETDLLPNDRLPAESLETALDKLTMLVQQLDDKNSRALKFAITDSTTSTTLPTAPIRANKFLSFDSNGNPTVGSGSVATDASSVNYTAAGVGAITRTVQSRLRDIVSVKDFGAVGDGNANDTAAFQAAIAATNNNTIYVPAGVYRITSTLVIDKNIEITGFPNSGSQNRQYSIIFHSPFSTGPLFTVTSGTSNGASIKNLYVTGGNGSFCIVSNNEYCEYERIQMDSYDGGGIQLLSTGFGSSSTKLIKCQWVGPNAKTNYTGFEINVSGGDVWMDGCTALRGAKGINILRGQTIILDKVSVNAQNENYSSASVTETGGIFLSGSEEKQAITIRASYIEDCTNGITAEYCKALTISANLIADTGLGSTTGGVAGSMIRLKSNLFNTTVDSNHVYARANGTVSVPYYSFVVNGSTNVLFSNNYLYYSGSNAGIFNISASSTNVLNLLNYYFKDTFSPVADVDPARILVDFNPNNGSAPLKFTAALSYLSWTNTFPASLNSIYKVYVSDLNGAGDQYTEATVLIDKDGNSDVSYQIQTSTDGNDVDVQVASGYIQVKPQTQDRLDRVAVMRIA